MSLTPQLALNVSLQDSLSFDNFFVTDQSIQALSFLKSWLSGERFQCAALWGGSGSGRSHLLQAAVSEADRQGYSALYLPCKDILTLDPLALLQGLENASLIALDDVDALAGNMAWEHALFGLYNALFESCGRMLVSSSTAATEIPFVTADVRSRLAWGVTFKLPSLSDQDKLNAMQMRSMARGMQMPDDVARYILSRSSRDFSQLLHVLDSLDSATIEAQRKLTIPFVRQVCGW
jgi:DnaA family protein